MKKLIECIFLLAASVAVGMIPWRDMPWSARIWAGLLLGVYCVWGGRQAYKEWRENRTRRKNAPKKEREPITSISISYPMLVAIVFGVFSIVWILIR